MWIISKYRCRDSVIISLYIMWKIIFKKITNAIRETFPAWYIIFNYIFGAKKIFNMQCNANESSEWKTLRTAHSIRFVSLTLKKNLRFTCGIHIVGLKAIISHYPRRWSIEGRESHAVLRSFLRNVCNIPRAWISRESLRPSCASYDKDSFFCS